MTAYIPVKSSNIDGIKYDGDTQTLHVKFLSGDTYRYEGVSPHKYQALMAAPSKGKHIHTNIKGLHPHSKVDSDR